MSKYATIAVHNLAIIILVAFIVYYTGTLWGLLPLVCLLSESEEDENENREDS